MSGGAVTLLENPILKIFVHYTEQGLVIEIFTQTTYFKMLFLR